MPDDEFQYTYSAPTENERREIEDIRKAYAGAFGEGGAQSGRSDKMDRLRALHRKVTRPATVILALGLALGVLLLGVGMSIVMTLDDFYIGIPIGVMGLLLLCIVYPVYRTVLKRRKNKYAKEILSLSEELLGVKK